MQECLGEVEKEAELGCAEAHHEEVRVVSRNKATSEMDEPGVRACDKDVGRSDSVMAVRAGCVITGTWTEMIRVIGMKGMSCDKLETCGLEIAGAPDEAPLSEVQKCASSGLGKNGVVQV